MAGLQRSVTSFRRQGSSGLVWDDKLLSGELNRLTRKEDEEDDKSQDQQQEHGQDQSQEVKPSRRPGRSINTVERSRSNGGRGFRTGKVSPAIDPPSPRVSACGFCSAFAKKEKARRRPKSVSGGRSGDHVVQED
ncbi:hypothetical protein U1Q18_006694 [Sarracenia purpurea var. burkii]